VKPAKLEKDLEKLEMVLENISASDERVAILKQITEKEKQITEKEKQITALIARLPPIQYTSTGKVFMSAVFDLMYCIFSSKLVVYYFVMYVPLVTYVIYPQCFVLSS
jgi:hypothetical protein